jgi:hypothetical protein
MISGRKYQVLSGFMLFTRRVKSIKQAKFRLSDIQPVYLKKTAQFRIKKPKKPLITAEPMVDFQVGLVFVCNVTYPLKKSDAPDFRPGRTRFRGGFRCRQSGRPVQESEPYSEYIQMVTDFLNRGVTLQHYRK